MELVAYLTALLLLLHPAPAKEVTAGGAMPGGGYVRLEATYLPPHGSPLGLYAGLTLRSFQPHLSARTAFVAGPCSLGFGGDYGHGARFFVECIVWTASGRP